MNYPSIEIQNLLSENLLDSLGQENSRHRFAQPESFSWEKYSVKVNKKNYKDQIAEDYENLIARWDLLSSDFPSMNLSDLREKWIKYFFSQFGFDLQYQKSAIEADSGNKFILSYRGWEGANAPIVHSSSFQQDLDDRSKEKTRKYSPHDTLQRFLNQSNSDLWGIVTNGRYLRILRDFSHQSRKAYIQFDLEMLFEGRHYEDFRILWRLLHPSRFIPKEDEKCILENLFEESKNAGVSIGEDLRKNISLAIESLANGFLLATPELLTKLVDNNENCMQFYQQILRIIYRILFLFYAEQRRLMPTRSTLYAQEYSMSSLRDKIERGETIDEEQFDLWEGLKATFNMVYHGVQELGITPYNGQLFNSDSVHWLINSQCRNDKLLIAIKYMSLFERGGITHRISYIELNVDEIGAIYESLLEYIPRISSKTETIESANKKNQHKSPKEIPPNTFFLDPRGTSRKTSGSYYTHPGLVNALIESALIPVVETKVKEAGPNKDAQEKALLSLKICDPACGSAAFLISATEYLGDKLAKIRIQDEYPTDTQTRHARRDVLRHCIYGVDLNPMAVELAKVSLWLIAATNDLPLNFLDHKIKCGNSLIGTTPELIKKGIPPEAYSPVEGDDKNIARKRIKIAREYYKRREQEKYQLVFNHVRELERVQAFQVTDLLEKYGEDSTREQREIEKAYKKHREDYAFLKTKYIADFWTVAFFWKHNDDTKNYPTPMMLDYLLENETIQLSDELGKNIKEISEEYKFFHWYLEFPEVFTNGGFDCVLGNPPWEKINFKDEEFFVYREPKIANAPTKHRRKQLIENLKKNKQDLYVEYVHTKQFHDNQSVFFRFSQKYPFTGLSRINLYSIFAELVSYLLNANGFAGIILPSGIVTDYNNKDLFQHLMKNNRIKSVYDFENRSKLFPEVDSRYRFSLLTISNLASEQIFSFYLRNVEDINDEEKYIKLDIGDIGMMNPKSKTCPIFREKRSFKIIKRIYQKFPLNTINNRNNNDEWKIVLKTPFNMANDSYLFEAEKKDDKEYVPLYEAKMIHQYDHRYNTYEGISKESLNEGKPRLLTKEEKRIENSVLPRYWIKKKALFSRYGDKQWYLVYRMITNATNERTLISCIVPQCACGHTLSLIENLSTREALIFLANINSFCMDFIVRQKLSGTSLTHWIFEQLPLIPKNSYLKKIEYEIIKYSFYLSYTTKDLNAFSQVLDEFELSKPNIWNIEKRLVYKSILDAIYFHLYSIEETDVEFIMDNFPLIKSSDMHKYGTYKTKDMILEKYEELKPMFK